VDLDAMTPLFKYDPEVDAAYIYLKQPIMPGEVAETVVSDAEIKMGAVNLDFDAAGHLLGIEILGATQVLGNEVLNALRK
jgi:uncharacterized protein YuzE